MRQRLQSDNQINIVGHCFINKYHKYKYVIFCLDSERCVVQNIEASLYHHYIENKLNEQIRISPVSFTAKFAWVSDQNFE